MNTKNILKQSCFTKHLIELNKLNFSRWIFEPGMLFLSEMKWWGDKGRRGHVHNGLDLLFYEDISGSRKSIAKDAKIPIMYDGRIVNVIKDFLGYSLFVAHEIYHGDSQLFTMYGHVLKLPDISIDTLLPEGSPIAIVAGDSNKKVPAHLHISIAFIPQKFSAKDLSWELLDNDKSVRFIDPQTII